MSVISDIGNFVGSGKAENVFNSVAQVASATKNMLSSVGIVKTSSNSTAQQTASATNTQNAVSKALADFESGYLKGRFGSIVPVALFAGAVLFAVYLFKKGK